MFEGLNLFRGLFFCELSTKTTMTQMFSPPKLAMFSMLLALLGAAPALPAIHGPNGDGPAHRFSGVPASCGPTPGIRFVNDNATGTNDGSTWDNAHTSLAAALAVASPGEQIWVKEGTYRPTNGLSRSVAFRLRPDVSLFGGFADNGCPLFAERNPAIFPTVLSGDIGVLGSSADNSLQVVVASNVGSNVTVDGFTIRDAQSNTNGGGLYILGNGAGQSSSPTFLNCTFIGNFSARIGGAAFIMATNNATVNPSFTSCTFANNSAQSDGGGMGTLAQKGGQLSANLDNCIFTGNTSLARGGAMHNLSVDTGVSTLDLSQCTFSNNTAATNGGGISNFGRVSGTLTLNLSGSTFAGNSAANGAGVFHLAQGASITSNFDSNLFLNNTATSNGSAICAITELAGALGQHNLIAQQFIGNTGAAGAFANISTRGGLGMATLDRVVFRDNTASLTGGAVHIAASSMGAQASTDITNTVFFNNSAARGGGALYQTASITGLVVTELMNTTLSGNTSPTGGAVQSMGNGTTALFDAYNTIFWQNPTTGTNGRPFHSSGASSSFIDHCIIDSVDCMLFASGSGSLSCGPTVFAADPLFVDPLTGDLHLLPGSPAVDLGTSLGAPATDLDNNARPSGAGHDIGAYESIGPLPRMALTSAGPEADACTLFPNPTDGHATLRPQEGVFENAFLQVFDLQGRAIQSHGPVNASSFELDLSGHPTGVYLVQLNAGGKVATFRLVLR
jgi:predicted outer membrane repeat protein